MKKLLMFSGVALAFSGLAAWGQVSSTTLRSVFGNPKGEVFAVAQDVDMTVSYDTNHNACLLVLKPDAPTSYPDSIATSQRLHELLDRAVPGDVRGEKSDSALELIAGCAGFKTTRYQRVDITETIFASVNPTCTTQMEIQVRFTATPCPVSATSGK